MTKSFELGNLNHVGVAVPNIEASIEHYRRVFNATDISEIKDLPDQGVKVAFVNLPSGQVELIEPLGENSPIHGFLKRNPLGGQHHICFEVENIYEALEQVYSKGIRVLNQPRIGAHGTLIIFLHPKDMNGTLIELMERPK
ncbi:MAG: methylmalonyl-CoA epimerase [Robiginitomaculum sp.]|nr:MAG: methylmalonyl-CoA epimerase [Robiginitomaculum sp.]